LRGRVKSAAAFGSGLYFWKIGYYDWKGTNVRVFELNESIGLSPEPLEVGLMGWLVIVQSLLSSHCLRCILCELVPSGFSPGAS